MIQTIDYVLAAAGLFGHCILLWLLVRLHLLRRLPFFALLTAFYLLRSSLLLVAHTFANRPYVYWLLVYLDPGLQLLVMVSLALLARPLNSSVRFGSLQVALFILLFLTVAMTAAWLIGPSSHYSPQNLAIKITILISTLWLQIAIALSFTTRSRSDLYARLALGIASGFAVYSGMNIATQLVHMYFVSVRMQALFAGLSYFRVIIYLGCLTAWSVMLLKTKGAAAPNLSRV